MIGSIFGSAVIRMIGTVFGWIAMGTAIIGLVPQVVKSYKTKSTNDLSMAMLVNYLVGSAAWIIHGLCIDATFVVWSNIFGGTVSLVSILQKLFYDHKCTKEQLNLSA